MTGSNGNGRVSFESPDFKLLVEQGYLFADMHFHTNCSDSFTDVNKAYQLAKSRGTGFAVTDHNLIDSALKIADREEVFTVPGIEVSTADGPHILLYFYEGKDLQDFWSRHIKPDLPPCPWLALNTITTEKLLSIIEREDTPCVTSGAHPMGYFGNSKGVQACVRKGYISNDVACMLDAYEVICSGMTHSGNLHAIDAAIDLGLGFTGGTDGHLMEEVGNVVTAVKSTTRDEFLDGIKKGQSIIIGKEKTISKKVKMGSHSLARFVEHLPSASYVQVRSSIRSVKRFGSKLSSHKD